MAYIYQAALLCNDCGRKTRAELTAEGKAPKDPNDECSYDSDDFPKGPIANGGGAADSPQHCDNCHVFLENQLTTEGLHYVFEAIIDHLNGEGGDQDVIESWLDYYEISAYNLFEYGKLRNAKQWVSAAETILTSDGMEPETDSTCPKCGSHDWRQCPGNPHAESELEYKECGGCGYKKVARPRRKVYRGGRRVK